MTSFFKKIASFVSWIISWLLPYNAYKVFRYLRNEIFSFSASRTFGSCGVNFRLEYPAVIIGSRHISIGDNFLSFAGLRIEAYERHLNNVYKPEMFIGNNVSFNFDCHIGCINRIIIGDNVLIASRVFITDHFHGEINGDALGTPPSLRKVISPGAVHIEDNVWIGEGVSIMPNLTIGRNSIVGANSVVTKSVPPNCVVAGVPAKIIRQLR